MEEDWRLANAQELNGQPLRHKAWTRWSESWDHDHCAACWAKFAEFDGPDIQKTGYATTDTYKHGADYAWVCEACFTDLKAQVGWFAVK